MIRRIAFALALALLPSPAFAWGYKGHTIIDNVGASQFPSTLPAFVRSASALDEITYLGPEEDRIKGAGRSWDDDNDPGHFTDIGDDGTIAGVVKMTALPLDMKAYAAALASAGTDPYKQGFLPYEIMDGWERLRTDFAIWRVDDYMATHATTAAAKVAFARARQMRESLTLRDLGDWSHFVGDGSQPLHNTIHYNDNGWHSKFESEFVNEHVSAEDVRLAMSPQSVSAPTAPVAQAQLAAMVGDYLTSSAAQVRALYALAENGGFATTTPQAVRFAAHQLARGAMELRDLTTLAWRDSLNARVDYPEIAVRDVLDGRVVPRSPI